MSGIAASRVPSLIWWLLPAGALTLLYAPVVWGMARDWWLDPNWSHGFLVPLVSGWLVWRRREELRRLPARPSWWGLGPLLWGSGMFLVGVAGAEWFTLRCSLLVVLAGMVLLLWGPRFLRAMAFPLGFLAFMIPLPYLVYDRIAFPLRLLASRLAGYALFWLGVPCLREGNVLHLPGMDLQVVDACSGIRSLVALLSLALLLGYLELRGWSRRLALAALAIPAALSANALRLVASGLLAHLVGPAAAQGLFHEAAGLLVFGLECAMVLAGAWALR